MLKLSASSSVTFAPLRSATTSALPSNDSTLPRKRWVGAVCANALAQISAAIRPVFSSHDAFRRRRHGTSGHHAAPAGRAIESPRRGYGQRIR
jgi:hypothetical protein